MTFQPASGAVEPPEFYRFPTVSPRRSGAEPAPDLIRGRNPGASFVKRANVAEKATSLAPMASGDARDVTFVACLTLSPNPPMDRDGRREDSGRGMRELQER